MNYANPELHLLRGLVDADRDRVAESEAGFMVEKAQIGALKARLFSRLRPHFQKRNRLRLVVSYRRKYLEALVQSGEEDSGKDKQEHQEAEDTDGKIHYLRILFGGDSVCSRLT